MKQIVVIDPAMKTAETECYNTISLNSELKTTYHLPAMYGLQSLLAIDMKSVSGIIIFGSASSVYDRLPWQEPLEGWLKPQLEIGIPTLAICYGHQMLAYMFGGKVGYVFPDQKKYSCMRTIEVKSLPWFESAKGDVVVSHNEMVTEVPESFHVIATSPECNTDGIAHKTLPIWSFQSHPEATKEFLINHNIESADKNIEKQLQFGHKIVKKFLDFSATQR